MIVNFQIIAKIYTDIIPPYLKAGITTREIDKIIDDYIRSCGARPACIGVEGFDSPFPAATCISVNEEVVHGIPSKKRILKDGDVVSLDAGVIWKGYHSDAARTHIIGEGSEKAKELVKVTRECFYEGIKYAIAGNHLNDICKAIGAYAKERGYGVVRDLVGHGIGTHLHEDPEVPNFDMKRGGIKLQPGMTLAIEPMITAGRDEVVWLDDDWTVVTDDNSLAAHYENTILITEGEPEILSLRKL